MFQRFPLSHFWIFAKTCPAKHVAENWTNQLMETNLEKVQFQKQDFEPSAENI